MADLSLGKCFDGPRLVAWLKAEWEWRHLERLEPRHRRCLERWESGMTASVRCADEVLTALEVPLSWVPDELICRYDNGRCRQAA